MNIEQNVFSPGEISTITVNAVRAEKNVPGRLLTGISQLDDHFVMFRGRKVIGVMADTSNGKTSVMSILAKSFMSQLREQEIILWVTFEDSIEDMGMNSLANISQVPVRSLFHGEVTKEEWGRMITAAAHRAAQPIWAMGHSETAGHGRSRLTLTDIWAGVDFIRDVQEKKLRVIFLDYLQRINTDDVDARQIREKFMYTMDKVKDLALDSGACVIIGTQITRKVQEREWKMPQVHDAQETSNFEQTCDGIISLWIPKRDMAVGEPLPMDRAGTASLHVTERLLLMQTLKQKRGEAPRLMAVDFHPETNEIKGYTR
jgi:replicative DNA helicase